MSTSRLTIILAAAVGAGAGAAVGPSAAEAQQFQRLSAEFNFFGAEVSTNRDALDPVPANRGRRIYTRAVNVPANQNVLFFTLSTTGDSHDGAAGCFSALIDGRFFNSGAQGASRCANAGTTNVPGWVTLIKEPGQNGDPGGTNCADGGGGPGDCHDNVIYYQWCTPIRPGAHEVRLHMASDTDGKAVFIEQAFFYIDSANIASAQRCTRAAPPAASPADEAAGAEHGRQ